MLEIQNYIECEHNITEDGREYFKYADGRLICCGNMEISTTFNNYKIEGLYVSPLITLMYPMYNFIRRPIVTVSGVTTGDIIIMFNNLTVEKTDIFVLNNRASENAPLLLTWKAEGYWK